MVAAGDAEDQEARCSGRVVKLELQLYRIRDEVTADARARLLTGQEEQAQASIARLRAIDPDDLSPREALRILYELGSVTHREND